MDSATVTVIVIAFFALIAVASFLVFRQRGNIKIKGPSNIGLELDASNDPIPHRPGIEAENITSRKGGVVADDTTGQGVKVKEVDVEDDILLSSSYINQENEQKKALSANVTQENNPTINAQSVMAGGDAILAAAGHDVVIQIDQIKSRVNELVDILNGRAERITSQLAEHYEYVEVKSYLDQFKTLHKQHVEALEKGNIIHAHEVLGQLHELSFRLERDEFWRRHTIETPTFKYQLRHDAFKRGRMICAYVVGDMSTYSPKYPSNESDMFSRRKHELRDSLILYHMMLSHSEEDKKKQSPTS